MTESPAEGPPMLSPREQLIQDVRRGLYNAGTKFRTIGEQENKWGLNRFQCEGAISIGVSAAVVLAAAQNLVLTDLIANATKYNVEAAGSKPVDQFLSDLNANRALLPIQELSTELHAPLINKEFVQHVEPSILDKFKYIIGDGVRNVSSNMFSGLVALNNVLRDGKTPVINELVQVLNVAGLTVTSAGDYYRKMNKTASNGATLLLMKLDNRANEKVPLSSTLKYAGMVMQRIGLPPAPAAVGK